MNTKNVRIVATILALIGIMLTLLNAVSTRQVFYLVLGFVLIGTVILNILPVARTHSKK